MKKLAKYILIILFIELVIFNFKVWESLGFDTITTNNIQYGEGLEQIGENQFVIQDSQTAYFELSNINTNIKNIYLDITKDIESRGDFAIPIKISMTDAANSLYRELPQTEVVQGFKESQFIRLHLIGKSEKLKVSILCNEGDTIKINNIVLNAKRPFLIRPIRIMLISLCIWIYTILRYKSKVYSTIVDYSKIEQRKLIRSFVILHMLAMLLIGVSALPFVNWERDTWAAHAQYEDLADALIGGHVYLKEEPPKTLETLKNPYDTLLREKELAESNESYLFDFAYYNGKYYSYFGVLPAILFFVPFQLLTGHSLQTWIPVMICGILYCPVSFWFIYQIIKKYFKNISLGIYLLMASVFIAGSSIIYLVHFGNVYSMPIMFGLLLGVLGLGFWISSVDEKGSIRKNKLILGSLCIASIIACRPQLAIILFLAFPIFMPQIKQKLFFSKKGILNTLCVIVPFLIIGLLVMWYNYIRFGSPLDFGANYNLTSNDMTHKGFVFSRNWLGIFEYLFQPLNIKSKFPFFYTVDLQTEYQGYISSEPLFGGFIMWNVITIFNFAIYKYRNLLKRKQILGLTTLSLISSLIIIEVNIQMSGLTQRYMSDFGWLFILPSILIILSLFDSVEKNSYQGHILLRSVIILSIVCIGMNYFNIFLMGRYASLIDTNPILYYFVKYAFFRF